MCTSVGRERGTEHLCRPRTSWPVTNEPGGTSWTSRNVSGYLIWALPVAGRMLHLLATLSVAANANDYIDIATLRNPDDHLPTCLSVDPSRLTVNPGKRAQGCLDIFRTYGRSKGLGQDWKIESSMRTSRSFVDQP